MHIRQDTDPGRQVEFAIMPIGTSVCVLSPSMIEDLPKDLRHDIAIVQSGTELLSAITHR